jgi:hypothetical protein
MSDWQPARLNGGAHPSRKVSCPAPLSRKPTALQLVRVRPIVPKAWIVNEYRSFGCYAASFVEIHPDDIGFKGSEHVVICEHEILTD